LRIFRRGDAVHDIGGVAAPRRTRVRHHHRRLNFRRLPVNAIRGSAIE
jgi:hypothetical protein